MGKLCLVKSFIFKTQKLVKCLYEVWIEIANRPFSYSESECGSNDISLQFVEFSNVHNCDRSSNATLSNLAYKIV